MYAVKITLVVAAICSLIAAIMFIINDENGYLVEQGDVDSLAECMLDLLDNPDKAI